MPLEATPGELAALKPIATASRHTAAACHFAASTTTVIFAKGAPPFGRSDEVIFCVFQKSSLSTRRHILQFDYDRGLEWLKQVDHA